LARKPKRRKIKSNRKPRIVRDKSWKARVLRGEEADWDDLTPQLERVVPRGREEERVKLWNKVDKELQPRTETVRTQAERDQAPGAEQVEIPEGWQRGIVTRVSTSLYDVDLDKQTALCAVRGALSAAETGYTNVVAVGDEVLVSFPSVDEGPSDEGVIEYIYPRHAVLARPDVVRPDWSQIIVANVDQVLIVSSWEEPALWLELLDRYLIATITGQMTPLICLNKIDLALDLEHCFEEMALYQELGYTVLLTSVETGQGIDELRTHLIGRRTVLAGMSGVGKSSLLQAVQPDLELRVAEVSTYSGEGMHTTTQVSLLKLHEGGYVVDTPGIRELGLITVHRHELVLYFPEIAAWVGQCRFNDCTHTHEPGCAVIQAVENGEIAWTRYKSYQAIYESLPEYYTE
jgi:ribosome biogenesis GTPase